jgi:hypothetical protein
MLVLPNFKGLGSGAFCTNPFLEKRVAGLGFVVSHPSRKNKDAARVGHPGWSWNGQRLGWGLWFPTLAAKTKTRRGGAPGMVVERASGGVGGRGFPPNAR